MVDISLIVPTSPNSDDKDLQSLLGSVANQTMRNLEVLVVSEGDRAFNIGDAPQVRILPLSGKRGASAARNHGARFSSAEILAFLDDDVVLDAKWCESAVSSFSDRSIGGVSGRALVPLDKYGLDYIPRELMWVVGGCYWNSNTIKAVSSAAGMNFCVRKEAFIRVGGYDESLGPSGDRPEAYSWLRLGAEEDDLALKIQGVCGKKLLFNPEMLVTHRLRLESVSSRGLVKRSLHVGHNRAYIHAKYPENGTLSDISTLRRLVATTAHTALSLPRHPLISWKKLSFTGTVVIGLGTGYAIGFLRFKLTFRGKAQRAIK